MRGLPEANCRLLRNMYLQDVQDKMFREMLCYGITTLFPSTFSAHWGHLTVKWKFEACTPRRSVPPPSAGGQENEICERVRL